MKEGWEYKTIKDCCTELFAGGDVPKPDISRIKTPKFTVPIYTNGVEKEGLYGYTNNARVNEPAVTISARGTIGATFRRYIPFYPAIRLITAVPNKEIISIDYLYYALKTLTVGNSGTSIPQLTIPNIKKLVLPVPPLSEQQTIVDYLDSAFAKIEEMKVNAEKALNEAKALFQASLNKMFEPKEGWEEKKIKEIGTVIGGTTPNTNVSEYWNGTLCWISPAELNGSHYLYDSKYKITEAAVKAKNLKLLPEGTVILSSRAPIGKVVINKIPTYCNQGFKCVICGENIYNEFLYWWFWGKTKYLNSLGTGATFKEISKKIVEEITIPVPPISEQKTIADYLENLKSKVDHLQGNFDKISKECDAMKQAILRQVFE